MNMMAPETQRLMQTPAPEIYVDHTHLGRHVTGLERITCELFGPDSLAPLQLTPLRAKGKLDLILKQNIALPRLMARRRDSLILCPGFPPSYALSRFGARVIPYIHDMFLLTRRQDLNIRARLYMASPFRKAVKTLPRFLVNSEYTAGELRGFCREDAEILLYRPQVENVFDLAPAPADPARQTAANPLRLIALGTVEPRKNLLAAARICKALREKGHPGAELHIIGRKGWGEDFDLLGQCDEVTLHGYQPAEKIRDLISNADLFINTSHDEGLGLPLLEAQYAGLPVIAPDQKVFREVLGDSGLLIDPAAPDQAATRIAALLERSDWRADYRLRSAANLERWNSAAQHDRNLLIEMLYALRRS